MKLYDGKTLPDSPRTTSRAAQESQREGMDGISPATSRTRSPTPWQRSRRGMREPLMVINELESGLRHHSLITSDRHTAVPACCRPGETGVRGHRKKRGPAGHHRRTRSHRKLCPTTSTTNGLSPQKEKVKNRLHRARRGARRRLMRSIEEKIDIPDSRRRSSAARS